jgi:DNA (cytosine-5)-methyltransferase 1
MNPRVSTFFSGAGLMDIGLRMAGVELVQSFEIDPACCAVASQLGHRVVSCDISRKLALKDDQCDAMGFSYPCTKYSTAAELHGQRTGDELFLHALRHIALQCPEIYWVENVPGMKKFPVVMEAMTKLPNYYVTTFCPVSSQTWLPQRRDRLIIIGAKRNFLWRPPESPIRTSLRDVLEENPQVEIPGYVIKRLDGSYRDMPIVSDPDRDDIAPTCVAHYAKDRSTRLVKDKRFPRGVRPYTVREYARLQGVPDWFKFDCGESEAYRMIGNGVSVPVGHWIGTEILRYFNARN